MAIITQTRQIHNCLADIISDSTSRPVANWERVERLGLRDDWIGTVSGLLEVQSTMSNFELTCFELLLIRTQLPWSLENLVIKSLYDSNLCYSIFCNSNISTIHREFDTDRVDSRFTLQCLFSGV